LSRRASKTHASQPKPKRQRLSPSRAFIGNNLHHSRFSKTHNFRNIIDPKRTEITEKEKIHVEKRPAAPSSENPVANLGIPKIALYEAMGANESNDTEFTEDIQKQEGCYRFSLKVPENLWPQNRF
jgi:hypothetical protein